MRVSQALPFHQFLRSGPLIRCTVSRLIREKAGKCMLESKLLSENPEITLIFCSMANLPSFISEQTYPGIDVLELHW